MPLRPLAPSVVLRLAAGASFVAMCCLPSFSNAEVNAKGAYQKAVTVEVPRFMESSRAWS